MNSRQTIKIFLPLSIFISIVATFLACEDNPVDPIEPGRSDYVWEIDTLSQGTTSIMELWGTSPKNIWAMGVSWIGGGSDALLFDDERWQIYQRDIYCDCIGIVGHNSNNIWAVGIYGNVYYFNGNIWKQDIQLASEGDHFLATSEGEDGEIFVTGTNNKDGFRGIIYKYKQKWEKIEVGYVRGQFNNIAYSKAEHLLYIKSSINDSSFIYTFDGREMQFIMKRGLSDGKLSVRSIADEVLIVFGNTLYQQRNKKLIEVLKIDNPEFTGYVRGRNRKDLFMGMKDGLVHYNGNYQYLIKKWNDKYYNPKAYFLFDNAVVFSYEDYKGGNIIYRGYLK